LIDAQLIQASIQGNENAFKMLVERYQSQVAAAVIGMLGPGQEAEDTGQETFIRFYQNLRQFRGDSSVATYLTRIAMNLSLNKLKKKRKMQSRFRKPLENFEQTIADPDFKSYDNTKELIQQALDQLKPEFRSVIVLRFFQEYSIREISEVLKIPQGTVLSRLARAQKKLHGILAPIFGEYDEEKNLQSAAEVI
jgi:RNA polymerase sigma-70 factor (ECF subfamily)